MNGPRLGARPVSVAIAVVLSIACIAPAASGAALAYATAQSPQYVSGHGSWARPTGVGTPKRVVARRFALACRVRTTGAWMRTITLFTSSLSKRRGFTLTLATLTPETRSGVVGLRSPVAPTSRSIPQETGSVKVTASIRTCLDVPFRSDPCSGAKTHSPGTYTSEE